MPPKRRKRDNATAEAPIAAISPEPSPSPAREEPPSPSQSDDAATTPSGFSYPSSSSSEPPRFFNTTFTTYRASPLYLGGNPLTPARLQILSRRLRDALVGDVVRGVQVGLVGDGDGGALGRTGALEAAEWRWVDAARILGREEERGRQGRSVELGGQDDSEDRRRDDDEKKRVLCVELRYENARFSALLMPNLTGGEDPVDSGASRASWTWQADGDGNGEVDGSAFLHLPLVIFRMPAPLKSVLISFLSNTFDCRIGPLALGTRTLVSSWEAWLSDSRQAVSKDVLFTLGFHLEPPGPESEDPKSDVGEGNNPQAPKPGPQQQLQGLKTIDIAIPAAEVHRFLRIGEAQTASPTNKRKPGASTVLSEQQQRRRRRKLAGGKDEEGWAWRGYEEETETIKQPFAEALAAYTWQHLGLDMFHPGVRVQRVACDAFALSEGRLKVFAPADDDNAAVWRLVRDLARRARGNQGWGSSAAIGMIM